MTAAYSDPADRKGRSLLAGAKPMGRSAGMPADRLHDNGWEEQA
ncbi:hypothetical protein KNP414_05565 [Paenibacillus mucilaginosus KNP414]|uniref:Uncharacterized protein n=1 Tax=Paenibacillus mucilaginosus (strain KNP414) TaxID=1036673 RepID=F8FK48_PAEMK|nr:hypothetical protein KNP414_05565 [Paenibacillus mucilaginosus KNP414]